MQCKVWTCIYGTYNIWQIYNYVWNSTIQLTSVGLIQEFPQLSTLLWRTALLAVRYRKSGNFRSRIQLKMPVCHYSYMALGSPSKQCHTASIDPPTHYGTISIWSRSHMRLHLLISVVAHTSEAPYTYSCHTPIVSQIQPLSWAYCNKQLVNNCLCYSRQACLPIISWHILLPCAHAVVNWPWELCSFDNFEGLHKEKKANRHHTPPSYTQSGIHSIPQPSC